MQTGTAGEQTITIRNLNNIRLRAAGGDDGAGAAVFPQVDIRLGIERDDALAGCAGGRVNAHALFNRRALQPIGIRIAQVRLGKERQLVQVTNALDVLRRHALFFHLLAVVGNVVPDMLNLLNKTLVLPRADLLLRCSFNFRLIVVGHGLLLLHLVRGAW